MLHDARTREGVLCLGAAVCGCCVWALLCAGVLCAGVLCACRLCTGAACVCSQQEMWNAFRAWKGLQPEGCFWLRRQNLEILIMFILGATYKLPRVSHKTQLRPRALFSYTVWLIYFQKGLMLTVWVYYR